MPTFKGPIETVALRDGDRLTLLIESTGSPEGAANARIPAIASSSLGPLLRVMQGAQVHVQIVNRTRSTLISRWQGRDAELAEVGRSGVAGATARAGRRTGGPAARPCDMDATLRAYEVSWHDLRFADPGVYGYRLHDGKDPERSLGGAILVVPNQDGYWAPVNREGCLVLDEARASALGTAASRPAGPQRSGHTLLVNGAPDASLDSCRGEVLRLYLLNAAGRRFNLRIPGARMKRVGSDRGRIEREAFIEQLRLAPFERGVVDVLFDRAGSFQLEHRIPGTSFRFCTILVADECVQPSLRAAFETLRYHADFKLQRARFHGDLARPPDISLVLTDTLRDGAEGGRRWHFDAGVRVKLRLINQAAQARSVHVDGQRFLLLDRAGAPSADLAWKDTLYLGGGEVADLLVELPYPRDWTMLRHTTEKEACGVLLAFTPSDGIRNERACKL